MPATTHAHIHTRTHTRARVGAHPLFFRVRVCSCAAVGLWRVIFWSTMAHSTMDANPRPSKMARTVGVSAPHYSMSVWGASPALTLPAYAVLCYAVEPVPFTHTVCAGLVAGEMHQELVLEQNEVGDGDGSLHPKVVGPAPSTNTT